MKHAILPTEDFLQTARPVVEDALAMCEQILLCEKEARVIINYTEDPFVIEKMGGSTGRAENETTITIAVNMDIPNWKNSLKGSVVHEYNHLVWYQTHGKDWQGMDLGEMIIFEGLAQHFEEQLAGTRPPWATAIPEEKAREVWGSIKDRLNENSDRLWTELSFEDNEYPLWSGYTLAYLIIQKQIQKRGMSWPELMKIKTEELLRF